MKFDIPPFPDYPAEKYAVVFDCTVEDVEKMKAQVLKNEKEILEKVKPEIGKKYLLRDKNGVCSKIVIKRIYRREFFFGVDASIEQDGIRNDCVFIPIEVLENCEVKE